MPPPSMPPAAIAVAAVTATTNPAAPTYRVRVLIFMGALRSDVRGPEQRDPGLDLSEGRSHRVLIEEIDQQIAGGKQPRQAVVDSSVSRLRPVVLAAATTILGLIPLLQDVFFVNMSITIMAGLGFATLLTLFIVPVLYSLFFRVPYRDDA